MSFQEIQTADGAINRWRFTESSGTDIDDQEGADDGTISGATLGVGGQVDGTACKVNGTDGGFSCDANVDYSSYNHLVFSGIIKLDGEAYPDDFFFCFGDATDPGTVIAYFEYETSGYLKIYLNGNVGYNSAFYTKPTLNVFHHIAIRLDYTQTPEEVQFYLDGVQQTAVSRPNSSNNTGSFSSSETFDIFNRPAGDRSCDGTLQHFAVYPGSSLTDAKILNQYNAAFVNPTISDVDGDENITFGQNNVPISGAAFLTAQGNDGKVEISDNATYGAGTVVEQVIGAGGWSNGLVYINVTQGGLSAGTGYVWVTHNGERRNVTGFPVTLVSGANDFTVEGKLPLPDGAVEFEQVNEFGATSDFPVPSGDVSFTQANDLTAEAAFPIPESFGSFEQLNTLTANGVFPVLEGEAIFSNVDSNDFIADSNLPLPVGDAVFSQENLITADSSLPVPTAESEFTQNNQASIAAEFSVMESSAAFTQKNTIDVSAEFPVPVAEAVFQNISANLFTAASNFPLPVGEAEFTQENEFTAQASLPVPKGDIVFTQKNIVESASSFPLPESEAIFDQANQFNLSSSFPLPESHAVFTNAEGNLFTIQGIFPVLESFAIFGSLNPPGRVVCSATERTIETSASRDDLPEIVVNAQARRVDVDSMPMEGEASP